MRLSDAILLGSTMMKKWTNSFTLDCNGVGCAIGMALTAVSHEGAATERNLPEYWPWIKGREFITPPDGYGHCYSGSMWKCVTYMFYSVIRGKKPLEWIVDWVRSVEPKEAEEIAPEGQANAQRVACETKV